MIPLFLNYSFTFPLFVAIICWLASVWCKMTKIEAVMNKEAMRYTKIVDKFKLEK